MIDHAPFGSSGISGIKKVAFLLLPTLIVLILLWLPFGFHMGPLVEEWGLLGLYVQHGPIFFADADSLIPWHQMRPIMTALWAAAYALDPNSWLFWHAELALLLLLKGVSMSWLGLYLTKSHRWAVVAGLLFVVWPADVMQMAFRAMPITLAVGLSSASAALFIASYLAPHATGRTVLSVMGAACIVLGSWTYELTLLLAPLPFLLIYAREGLPRGWAIVRRAWQTSIAWIFVVAGCASYILHVTLTAQNTYQQNLAGTREHLFASLTEHAPCCFHGELSDPY